VRAKLHQTELDLQNEQDARRRLQQETKHLVEEAKSKVRLGRRRTTRVGTAD